MRLAAGHRGEYRPELDGVRGLAILLVVVAHALPRGTFTAAAFAGVGLFFVLSGYLITGVLLRSEGLREFYIRRVARLAPPLILTLIGVGIAGSTAGIVPAVLYVANWPLAFGGSLGPLDHIWSLAIEEQFYLVWPFVLVFFVRRAPAVLMIAAASALIRFGLSQEMLYYATPARLDGLLLGAAIAITGWRANLTWLGLLLVGLASVTGIDPTSWSLGAISIGGALLVGSTPRVLLPLAGLGRISYSLYLYHVPLVWAFGPVGIAVALPLAWLSTRYIEEPIRARARGVRSR